MSTSMISLLIGVFSCVGVAAANNLGNVTSFRILKGVDGKQYIEIGHSGTNLQTKANTDFSNAGTTLLTPIVIDPPADEAAFMTISSMLQKALSCQCITFDAISGNATAAGSVTNTTPTPVIAAEYRFVSQ